VTAKRTKDSLGPFEYGRIKADPESDADEVLGVFRAASPQGRVATWRPHADRLDIGGDLLDQAEALIDGDGNLSNVDRFDALMAKAELEIERAQNEFLEVYDLAASRASHSKTLRQNAEARNETKRQESQDTNARLIALDDKIKKQFPKKSQIQRAGKIKKDYSKQLPEVCKSKPESITRRIRKARKKSSKK
jgi:hypothetical protein